MESSVARQSGQQAFEQSGQQPYAQMPLPGQQPYEQVEQPYAQAPPPGQQPYAQAPPPTGQQFYAPPPPQPPQPGQPIYGQQDPLSGLPMVQAPPVKKGNKAPLIIIAAVVACLLIGGIALVATGVLSHLFSGPKTAVVALYEGTENLVYDTSSATVEIQAGVGLTFKWDLGEDLAHSTIWGSSGGMGFVYTDDTLYAYGSSGMTPYQGEQGSGVTVYNEERGIIAQANEMFWDEYQVAVDLNKIVKNGTLDKDYLDTLNQALGATGVDSGDLGLYGLQSGDLDTAKVTAIIAEFMSIEANKKEVYEKFMPETETNKNGGISSYHAMIDPAAFFIALGDYARDRGKDNGYAQAADEVVNLCTEASAIGSYINNFTIDISIQNDILVGLDVSVSTSNGALSVLARVSEINSTDLDNDAELQAILDASMGSSYGDLSTLL
jgi:hypothetical protein